MVSRIFDLGWIVGKYFPALKRPLVRWWYQLISRLDHHGNIRLMNYGYAGVESKDDMLSLEQQDEINRSQVQLYHRVAGGVPLKGCDVLEVGSGRGGGASFVARHHAPRTYTGVELSAGAVDFCRKEYNISGLKFLCGNAEGLVFPENSFDAVINVESSSHYPRFELFLSEVIRVLKPGGHFLWADIRSSEEMQRVRDEFRKAGFKSLKEEQITPNVLRALELDETRKARFIQEHMPPWLHSTLKEFAASKGSRQYQNFQTGKWEYWNAVLQKPAML